MKHEFLRGFLQSQIDTVRERMRKNKDLMLSPEVSLGSKKILEQENDDWNRILTKLKIELKRLGDE